MNTPSHIIPTYNTWKPGALKSARRRRMRLAWSVWFIAAIFVLFQFFLQLSSGAVIDALMKSFTLTAFGGGVLASSYYYIYVLLQTPAGMLMDRYGPRGVLSIGAVVVCVGCLIFSFAKIVTIALLGRVLMGAGAAFAFVGCLNVISIWFPSRRFAFIAAIVETAGMFGAIIGNFWLANFIQKIGWRDCMVIAGIFSGVLSLFLVLIIRNAPRKKSSAIKYKIASTSLHVGLKKIARNPLLWANGIYCGLMFSVITVFIALWAIPFFELSHHVDLMKATMTASALYAGVAIGGPIIGWLDSRTQWRRKIMIVNGLGTSLALFAIIFFVKLPLSWVAVLLFFTGMFVSSYVLTFAIANEIATPGNRASTIGFTNMLCVIFAPLLQPLIGFLITKTGGGHSIVHFQYAISVLPALLLGTAAIGFFLPQRQRRGAIR